MQLPCHSLGQHFLEQQPSRKLGRDAGSWLHRWLAQGSQASGAGSASVFNKPLILVMGKFEIRGR